MSQPRSLQGLTRHLEDFPRGGIAPLAINEVFACEQGWVCKLQCRRHVGHTNDEGLQKERFSVRCSFLWLFSSPDRHSKPRRGRKTQCLFHLPSIHVLVRESRLLTRKCQVTAMEDVQ